MSALAEQRMAFIPVDDSGVPANILPDGHLKTVRRVVRLLDKYRAACTVLETYEDEFRRFRSMQAANRMTTAESSMRRAWDALDAGIEALRHQPSALRDDHGSEVSNHGAPYDAAQ